MLDTAQEEVAFNTRTARCSHSNCRARARERQARNAKSAGVKDFLMLAGEEGGKWKEEIKMASFS